MKKNYVIKYKMMNSGFGNGPREQIITARNEANAIRKFNWRNRNYLRNMTDINVEEIKIK